MNTTTQSQPLVKNQCMHQEVQLVHCDAPTQRFSVELIAHFANDVILVSMPQTPVANYLISRGKKFQIRLYIGNVIYTFNSHVVRVCQQPYICLRICNERKLSAQIEILQQLSA